MLLFRPDDPDASGPLPAGLTLEVDADLEALADRIASARTVVVRFPGPRDGRGFTLARLLRGRLKFRGRIYASGPLGPDQAQFLWRVGFDGVFVEDDAPVEAWRAASHRYRVFGQPDAPSGASPTAGSAG